MAHTHVGEQEDEEHHEAHYPSYEQRRSHLITGPMEADGGGGERHAGGGGAQAADHGAGGEAPVALCNSGSIPTMAHTHVGEQEDEEHHEAHYSSYEQRRPHLITGPMEADGD